MHSFVLSDRKLIWGTFDKHIFYFTDSLLLWGNHAQVVLLPRPITFPHLKRESNQVILLISHFQDSANKSVEMATPDDEVNGFLSPREEKEWEEAEKGKVCLPKFAPPQPFDGTMKDTKSFVSSLILYIYGRKAECPSNELKIMFVLSYIQGGKVQYWKNEAINLIAAGQKPLRISEISLHRWRLNSVIQAPKQPPLGN